MPLVIDLAEDDEEDGLEAYTDDLDSYDVNQLDKLAKKDARPEMLLEDHHDLEVEDHTISLFDEEDEAEIEQEPVKAGTLDLDSMTEEGPLFLGDVGDDNDTIVPADAVEDETFLQVKLPSPEELEFEKEVAGKPKLFIGEFCITVADKYNFGLYIWGAEKPKSGRYTDRVVRKFRPMGNFGSLLSALRAIERSLERCVLSVANGRHLNDAIQYLKRRDQVLHSCVSAITPSSFTSGQKVLSESLRGDTDETVERSLSQSSEPRTTSSCTKKGNESSSATTSTTSPSPPSSSPATGGKRTGTSRRPTRSSTRSKKTGTSKRRSKSKK